MSALTDKANLILLIVNTPDWEKDRELRETVYHLRKELYGEEKSISREKDFVLAGKYGADIVELHNRKLTPWIIARQLELTVRFVTFYLKEQGIKPHVKRPSYRKVFKHVTSGEEGTIEDFAKLFGFSVSTFDRRKKAGQFVEVGRMYFKK